MLNLELHEYQIIYNKQDSKPEHTKSFLNTVQHVKLSIETRRSYYILTGKPEELYKFLYLLNQKYKVKLN